MSTLQNSMFSSPTYFNHLLLRLNRMLYDFHKSQNDRRPGAVHATYLIYGTKKPVELRNGDGEDVEMTGSMPDVDSLADEVASLTLSLVQEERLKGMWPVSQ
jgi:DNA polymerase delta subunit 3